jgi:2,3-bisphosphoglycerate-independent phosphoglycerate mutase
MAHRPVLIVVRDGWGVRAERAGNAVALARTPRHDEWLARYPVALLEASSSHVGLPDQQMGSSEVGHLTIGAGRIIEHDLVRVDHAVASGELGRTPVVEAIRRAQERDRALHLVGLCSEGGVHSRLAHLRALLALARHAGVSQVFVHAITDGRDTDPRAGAAALRQVEAWTRELGVGRLATVSGRWWAMDRDRRWERTKAAWEAMVHGRGARAADAVEALEREAKGDEFLPPTVIVDAGRPVGPMHRGDQVIAFNFRGDRMRQLCGALADPGFDGFDRGQPLVFELVTMTAYDPALPVRGVAFAPQVVTTHLSKLVADLGRTQFKCAETEKFPHVTSFWNGGVEEPCAGEARRLVPSPRVPTYDLAPEMSARAVADATIARLKEQDDALVVVNFANADMVGHTGVLDAAVRAVEVLDEQVGRVVDAALHKGAAAIVTADHGNCEVMIDPATGRPHTAHTTNPVHAIVCDPRAGARRARADRCTLADVAPTALELLGLERPRAMAGRSVLV